jgi:DNA-binding transcriptional ArsR family regulator
MNRASSDTTPGLPPAGPNKSAGGSAQAGAQDFDWAAILPLVHPLKVAIIEAMHHIGLPMSASDLHHSLGRDGEGLSYLSYHVRTLAEAGVIVKVSESRGRGAKEKFYFFP